MKPNLKLVGGRDPAPPLTPAKPVPTVVERIRRHQAEAKRLAKNHVRALAAAMHEVECMAAEIAEGGDAYPPGVREVARRLVEDLDSRAQTLEAITARSA